MFGTQLSGRKCPRRKFPDANVQAQMSGLNYSDGKVRDANFRTQLTPRHKNWVHLKLKKVVFLVEVVGATSSGVPSPTLPTYALYHF